MPKPPPVEDQYRLLLACIKSAGSVKPDFNMVAKEMGGGLTASGASQRYYKLVRNFDKNNENGEASGDAPTPEPKKKQSGKRKADDADTNGGTKASKKNPRSPKKPKIEAEAAENDIEDSVEVKEEEVA